MICEIPEEPSFPDGEGEHPALERELLDTLRRAIEQKIPPMPIREAGDEMHGHI